MIPVPYPMTIRVSVGQPIVLDRIEVKESKLEFNDEEGQAVESPVQQVAGDGQRKPHWKEFDTWIDTPSSPSGRGAALGSFEARLRFALVAEIDGLTYSITRARVVARSPTASGYRLSIRMIGPNPDFIDAAGNPAPLW